MTDFTTEPQPAVKYCCSKSLLHLSYYLLYNMLNECGDEYINLYNFTEEFRVVFR